METVAAIAMPTASQRNRALFAGVLGNALEWFDFGVYGALIPTISRLFFPSDDPLASLLLSFGVYGIGFFVRPAGAVLFGIYGDRYGRRKALSAVIFMMGLSTLAIGLLPTYQQIGLLAPILLVLVRILQGLSAGGEWGGSAAYLVEFAPSNRRGFFGSLQQVSLVSGFLLGTLCAAVINQVLDPEAVRSWGWRLPFLFGLVLGFLGAYLRWRLDDTPKFVQLETRGEVSKAPLIEAFTTYRRATAVIFGVNLHNAVASNIAMTYMTSHIISQAHVSVLTALWINTACLATYVALIPLWGELSDRYGRKPFLLLSTGGFIVFSYPLFMLASMGNLYLAFGSQLIMIVFMSLFSGTIPAAYCEMFPTRVRYTAMSVGYNAAVAIFGGFAPLIATSLIVVTGNSAAPAFYVVAAAAISFPIILFWTKETAFQPLA